MKIYFNFAQDWPALVAVGLFICFIAYVAIYGKKGQAKDEEKDKKD